MDHTRLMVRKNTRGLPARTGLKAGRGGVASYTCGACENHLKNCIGKSIGNPPETLIFQIRC
jgi:hypothetical protein